MHLLKRLGLTLFALVLVAALRPCLTRLLQRLPLQEGEIPPKVFTMMSIVAMVTTVMTGPLLIVLLPRIGRAIPRGVEA